MQLDFFAKEYYESGKIGHTRKMLIGNLLTN